MKNQFPARDHKCQHEMNVDALRRVAIINNLSWGRDILHKSCVHVQSLQTCPTLCNPKDCNLPGSSVRGDSPGKNTRVGCHFLLQGNLPDAGIEPMSPAVQVDSLPLSKS